MTESTQTQAQPKLRHDPPALPGYWLQDRPAIPISRLAWLTIPLMIPFGFLFYVIGALLQPGDEVIFSFSLVNLLILLFIILVAVPVMHEAVHGITARIIGAKPFFGIGVGFAYTSFQEPVTPRQYMLITAAPLIILSIICLALLPVNEDWFLFILAFATTNAAGAIGDLWIINRTRRLPADALIYDLADGYAAFAPVRPSDRHNRLINMTTRGR